MDHTLRCHFLPQPNCQQRTVGQPTFRIGETLTIAHVRETCQRPPRAISKIIFPAYLFGPFNVSAFYRPTTARQPNPKKRRRTDTPNLSSANEIGILRSRRTRTFFAQILALDTVNIMKKRWIAILIYGGAIRARLRAEFRAEQHDCGCRGLTAPSSVGQTFLSAMPADISRADRNVCPTVVRNAGWS